MKTKLLKKIRKRFTIQKEGNCYIVTDLEWGFFTPFYSTNYRYKFTDSLDWIFEHYYSKETVIRRRINKNKKLWYGK